MKNIILTFIILLSFSCKAQSTISLEQAYEYSKSDDGIPETVTSVKDINNRLNQFVGIWKGTYGGKSYEFHFEKKLNFGNYSVKWDQLIGRIIVKNSSGVIIYNNLSEPEEDISFWGKNFQHRSYVMHFVGNYDCLESGDVFIETLPSNPNQMTLYYSQDKDGLITSQSQCPNFSTFVSLLPKDKMTLTKQ